MVQRNPLDVALSRAREDLQASNPLVVAARSSTGFQDGRFLVPFFQRRLWVDYPRGTVGEEGAGSKVSPFLQVLILHYLVNANGVGVADKWIAYRHLPGAYFIQQKFATEATLPLLRAFGRNPEGLRTAALRLGGMPIDRFGDVAFRFLALPRIPIACVLYLGEEEIPSSVNILFDEAAPEYLPTEDLIELAAYLGRSLRQR